MKLNQVFVRHTVISFFAIILGLSGILPSSDFYAILKLLGVIYFIWFILVLFQSKGRCFLIHVYENYDTRSSRVCWKARYRCKICDHKYEESDSLH